MNGVPIFCVDGGGSKSRGRLVDAQGHILADGGEEGPCNPSTNSERAAASVLALWQRCAAAAGLNPRQPGEVALAIGAAGLYVHTARDRFLAALPPFARTVTMSDGYAALIGAGGGKPCGLMIIGTGIAGHRLWSNGLSVQRDAWGWVAGDRGSGAWIGIRALRHATLVLDGIAPRDPLSDRVLAYFGGRAGLSDAISGIGPARLAELAPIVLAAADARIPRALWIKDRAAEHLAALARVLDIGSEDTLYAYGGLAPILGPAIADRLGHAVLTPEADPMKGCYLVAAGKAPTEKVISDAEESET